MEILILLVLQMIVIISDVIMDTIKHHSEYKSLIFRRWGWNKAKPSTFKGWLYRWFMATWREKGTFFKGILRDSDDAWHTFKRVMLGAYFLMFVIFSMGNTQVTWGNILPLLLIYTVLFWHFIKEWLYNKYFVKRKEISHNNFVELDDNGNVIPVGEDPWKNVLSADSIFESLEQYNMLLDYSQIKYTPGVYRRLIDFNSHYIIRHRTYAVYKLSYDKHTQKYSLDRVEDPDSVLVEGKFHKKDIAVPDKITV